MLTCDVLVVGGGAAGSVAALTAAKHGLNTILVERAQRFGGNIATKVDVTESRHIEPIVSELDLKFLGHSNYSKWFSPHASFQLKSRVKDYFVMRGSGAGSFDVQTLSSAKKAGCRILLGSTVDSFFVSNNIVQSAMVSTPKGKLRIVPKYVVCADGTRSKCRELLGLRVLPSKLARIRAFGITSKKLNMPLGTAFVFFDSELLPRAGYFYAVRTKSLSLASVVLEASVLKGKSLKQYYDAFVSQNAEVKKIVAVEAAKFVAGGCDAGWFTGQAHSNILFVGDAGFLMDPLFGYGVRQAVYSGYWASKSVALHAEHPHVVREHYKKKIASLLRENRVAWRARRVLNSMKNSDLDRVVGFASRFKSAEELDDFLDRPLSYPGKIKDFLLLHPKHVLYVLRAFVDLL